jgi:phage recombination protein Bet
MSIVKAEGSALAIDPHQSNFSPTQVAALQQIGVEHASPGDLSVFFHVCQRSGLDPFAKQIYMIGRNSRELVDGEWRNVVKQTIQTGIDGFRLIGRRAADRANHAVSVSAPEWAHEDGSWRPVWRKAWGRPVAARVTIHRGGEPFVAVALFDEYAQTKRDGELTQMWAQRPAGQIAKCAEALAWRLAFPQDLSGIYADVEMEQAESHGGQPQAPTSGSGADRAREALGVTQTGGGEGSPAETSVAEGEAGSSPAGNPSSSSPEMITQAQIRKLGVSMKEAGLADRDDALAYVASVIDRQVSSRNELTKDEASRVIDSLERLIASEKASEGDVVDAEIVDETHSATDAVWEQIVVQGKRLKMTEADLQDDYSQFTSGNTVADAEVSDLDAFLKHLQGRAA